MDLRRVTLLLVLVLLVAGCGGSDEDPSAGDGDSREVVSEPADAEPAPTEPDEAASTDTGAAPGEFELTPALEQCMTDAGFTQDAPPTGGLAAWRHPSGGRVVVGSGTDVTLGIASEIGTAERPANVEGSIVIAANEAEAAAADACLG